ncbi:hypothetical protein KIPB_013160 [Kipferlia bialata]|uniref:Uncharacterized protein n=1 Tax=Kipferlia bialata TaxID=797122 RepID=A0A391NS72_9EUKA|nr:hypothetical protein KIPB_013160 [Kipferlia bialata]|eukprot:g13160.t1
MDRLDPRGKKNEQSRDSWKDRKPRKRGGKKGEKDATNGLDVEAVLAMAASKGKSAALVSRAASRTSVSMPSGTYKAPTPKGAFKGDAKRDRDGDRDGGKPYRKPRFQPKPKRPEISLCLATAVTAGPPPLWDEARCCKVDVYRDVDVSKVRYREVGRMVGMWGRDSVQVMERVVMQQAQARAAKVRALLDGDTHGDTVDMLLRGQGPEAPPTGQGKGVGAPGEVGPGGVSAPGL